MSDTDGSNPYESPDAVLTTGRTSTAGGSIEATLNGDSELDFGDVASEAWQRTSGLKRILLGGMILFYLGLIVLVAIFQGTGLISEESPLGGMVFQLIITALTYPFLAGVIMLCLRQSVDVPIEFGQLFQYYGSVLTLAAIAILVSLLTTVGFILLILPGIYLSFATMLAIPLHVEKGLGVVDSITTSIKLVNKQLLTVILLGLAVIVAIVVGIMTIIGWIWLLPWAMMVMAIIYRQLAGVSFVE